jgi:trigger factor
MKYKLEKSDNILKINISDNVEEYRKKAIEEIKPKINIPGFRKGSSNISDEMIISHYNETLYNVTVDNFLETHYSDIIQKEKIDVLGRPTIKNINLDNNNIDVTLDVEVFPKFELGQYTGLKFKKPSPKISKKDINSSLEYLSSKQAVIKDSEKPVEEGNIVNIDFKGYIDNKLFDGGTAEAYDIRVGSKTFIDTFEDQLIGHSIDDEFDVNVTFPKDYGVEALKSKKAIFKVKINSIKSVGVPKIDDTLAHNEGFKDLEDLENFIKSKLLESRVKDLEENLFNDIITAITKESKVDVPQTLINNELSQKLEEYKNKNGKMPTEKEKSSLLENIKIELKEMLVIREILKLENINVSEDDLRSHILEKFNMKYEEVISTKNSERFINEVISNIRITKIKNFIISNNTN